MQIVSNEENLHEMSGPVFWRERKKQNKTKQNKKKKKKKKKKTGKNILNYHLQKALRRVLSFKTFNSILGLYISYMRLATL